MSELILHQYAMPFSEKARKVFVAVDATEVAIRRRDPALGDLVVHFPRAGYRVAGV